jgi:hypothetical protein
MSGWIGEIVEADVLCGEFGPSGTCCLPEGHHLPHACAVLVTW